MATTTKPQSTSQSSRANSHPKAQPKPDPDPRRKPKNFHNILLIVLFVAIVLSLAIGGFIIYGVTYGFPRWFVGRDIPDGSCNSLCEPYYDINSNDQDSPTKHTLDWDEKPLIYLYPETPTEISVSLGYPDLLTTTYPEYGNSWRVFAQPSGDLTDLTTGRSLYGLYWEGMCHDSDVLTPKDDGFIVARDNLITFLEEKLAILGLNEREANEFIIYWLPRLRESEYNYIRFATTAEIDSCMPLTVTPQPDTTIRVLMTFAHLQTPDEITITEQTLTPITRSGSTVVEWGGSELSSLRVR